MDKVYMVRHQHHGVVTSHVFASPPTPEQIEAIAAEAERLHGRPGRVTGWTRVVEAALCGATDVPAFEVAGEPSDQLDNKVKPGDFVGSGTGVVTPE